MIRLCEIFKFGRGRYLAVLAGRICGGQSPSFQPQSIPKKGGDNLSAKVGTAIENRSCGNNNESCQPQTITAFDATTIMLPSTIYITESPVLRTKNITDWLLLHKY